MWSFGCILAELYFGIPLFPVKNEYEHFTLLVEMLNYPEFNYISKGTKIKKFYNGNAPMKLLSIGGREIIPFSKNLSSIMKGSDKNFVNLLENCLTWNSQNRITSEEAMNHPFFLQNPKKEGKFYILRPNLNTTKEIHLTNKIYLKGRDLEKILQKMRVSIKINLKLDKDLSYNNKGKSNQNSLDHNFEAKSNIIN